MNRGYSSEESNKYGFLIFARAGVKLDPDKFHECQRLEMLDCYNYVLL